MEELNVNSVFLKKKLIPPRSVREEDAAAVLLEIEHDLEEGPLKVALQIPKLLDGDWCEEEQLKEFEAPLNDNQKLHEMLFNLEQENARTRHQLQQSQQEIMKLKSEVDS